MKSIKSGWVFSSLLGLALVQATPTVQAATLEACGAHSLSLVMEELPTSFTPWYGENEQNMWLWNQYMDIYRVTPSDGTFAGGNGVNEFDGFPPDADINTQYGAHWASGELAVTFTYRDGLCTFFGGTCCNLVESDIAANPSAGGGGGYWTDSTDTAEDDPNSVYYPSVMIHEIGHSWGLQTRNEDYTYYVPTVMDWYNGSTLQTYSTIHADDAYIIRRHYSDQTSIIPRVNAMVVSKYASTGHFANSTTDKTTYRQGEGITVQNLTIENTGTVAVNNPHVRLYLSWNRTISTGDWQLADWFWSSWGAESWGETTLSGTVPSSIPPGIYYVGALVTINGYGGDDLGYDDTTHLHTPITVVAAPPTSVTASDDLYYDKVQITWSAVPGAPYYQVYRSTFNGGATAISSWQTSTTFNDTTAAPGVTYYYWVRAAGDSFGSYASDYSAYDTGRRAVSLTSGTIGSYSDLPRIFAFPVTFRWCGVGINPSTDHDIQADQTSDFSSPYASSTYGGTTRDFVMVNGNLEPNGTHYAEVYFGSPSAYTIQAWSSAPILTLGTPTSASIGASEVLRIFEVYLTAGESYLATVGIGSGTANLSLFGFKSSRSFGSRVSYDWYAPGGGAGVGESLAFTADSTGYHSFVVVNDNAAAANYNIAVSRLTISGTVRHPDGTGIGGVAMTGLPVSTTTAADGSYSCIVPPGWSGVVTPGLAGFTFNPPSRSYASVSAPVTGQDYTGNPAVTVVATDPVAGEPGTGQGSGTFTFTRVGSTAAALTVNFTVGGTATAGSDYTALGTTVTFAIGASIATKTVSVLDDTVAETDETVVVTLASGAGYAVGSPSSATVTILDDDCAPLGLVTGMTPGAAQNAFNRFLGMRLQVGPNPLTVVGLGRVYISGNSHVHELRLVNVGTGTTVASVVWTPSGGVANQIKYVALAAPVTLAPNTAYDLASQEVSGGDQYYHYTTTVTTTSAASVTSAVYSDTGATWVPYSTAGHSYGPVSLQYCSSSVPTETVSVPTAVAGPATTFVAKSESYAASGSSSSLGHSLQYRFDWGDGAVSAWGSASQSHSWSNSGPFNIKAQARCATDTSVVSAWSGNLASVTVSFCTLTTSVSPSGSGTVTASPNKSGYNWNESVTLTAAANSGYTFSSWSGDASGTVNPTFISMAGNKSVTANFSGGCVPVGLVTGMTLGTAQNAFNRFLGMRLQVGANPLTVSALGRIYISGNSQSHEVRLVNVGTGTTVASVVWTPSGGVANQIKYVNLGSPVVLAANTAYDLASQEVSGGDQYYHYNTTVTTTSDASVTSAVYSDTGATWVPYSTAGHSYGPVSLQYCSGSVPTETVSVPTAVAGPATTFVAKSETYAASGSSSSLGHSLQYRFDWGDGTVSAWGNASQSYSWSASGTFNIKAQARCATDTSVVSAWSGNLASVTVSFCTLTTSVSPSSSGTVTASPNKSGYNWNESVTLTAAANAGYTFSSWSGNASGTVNPTFISMAGNKSVTANFSAGCVPVGLVTGMTLGTAQNAFTRFLGMRLQVGGSPLTVSALGRIYVTGNSQSHELRLVNVGTGTTVASVVWTPSGGVANQIKYVSLGANVVLAANTAYDLASHEVTGGDQYYHYNTTVTTTSAASVTSAVYSDTGATWVPYSTAGHSYGPVSLQYCGSGAALVSAGDMPSANPDNALELNSLLPGVPDEVSASNPNLLNLISPALASHEFTLWAPTLKGKRYILEFKNSWTEPTWTSSSAIDGDGAVQRLTDRNATNAVRLYRVRVE